MVIDGKASKVLIQEVAHDPLTDKITHADFHKVSLTDKMHAKIPLVFTGEAKAIKGLGGMLIRNVDQLEVECLPTDLIHEIIVDISKLDNFGDIIYLKDVTVPPGLTVKHLHGEDPIASVAAPRSEEELASLEAKPEEKVDAVEVIKKEKAAGDEEAPAKEEKKK